MAAAPRGTMDFFAAQAAARRHTFLLVVLFALAIALTVLLADAGISLALTLSGDRVGRGVQVVTGQGLEGAGAKDPEMRFPGNVSRALL